MLIAKSVKFLGSFTTYLQIIRIPFEAYTSAKGGGYVFITVGLLRS